MESLLQKPYRQTSDSLCHAKSVAWTNRVISPGIYNVSNGFTVYCRLSSLDDPLVSLTLFSDLSDNHFLGALLEPLLPSCVEREKTLNTPLWEGLADTRVSLIMLNGGDMVDTRNPCLNWSHDSS